MAVPMRVLVTGAGGFVGGAVVRALRGDPGTIVRAAVRHSVQRAVRSPGPALSGAEVVLSPELAPAADWSMALDGVDAVVHAAARVHVMRDDAVDPLAEYRRVNVAGTVGLAMQAARAGVHRFVFLSSIKVNGESTVPGHPYTAADTPAPVDAYGISKLEAEVALHAVAAETGLEVVVIRPVLVYGPGVKGNFLSMLRWLHRGVPLPLGAIDNRRSLVAIDNLVDLIRLSLRHPAAAGATFLVSDGEDLSTPDLLRRTAAALGTRARLLSVPPSLITLSATALGRRAVGHRLCSSLQVDIQGTRTMLGWSPPLSVDEGLRSASQYFNATHGR